jgi:hypothetical protein
MRKRERRATGMDRDRGHGDYLGERRCVGSLLVLVLYLALSVE